MALRWLLLLALFPCTEGKLVLQADAVSDHNLSAHMHLRSSPLAPMTLRRTVNSEELKIVTEARATVESSSKLFDKFGTRFENAYDISLSDVLQSTSDPTGRATIAYATAATAVASLLAVIYGPRGVGVCAAIECYIFALSIMTVLIRTIFVTYHFPYPKWVTATHFLATACVSGGALYYQRRGQPRAPGRQKAWVPDAFTWCVGVLPVGGAFAASIAFSNQALLHANAHFFEMFSSLGLLVTAGLGFLLGRSSKPSLVPPLIVLTVGLLIVSLGEVECSWMGVFFIGLGMLFRSAKAQFQAMLLSGSHGFMTLDAMALVFWTSGACTFFLVPWSLATEGLAPFVMCTEPGILGALALGMVNASFLNIASLFVLKELGPVAQQAVGNFKSILACLFAVVAFSETIETQQIVGYAVVIAACTWYNQVDTQQPRKQEEEGQRKVRAPISPYTRATRPCV